MDQIARSTKQIGAAFRRRRRRERLKDGKFHPLLMTTVFVVMFLEIHPFQDSNGRLSRTLTRNGQLARHGAGRGTWYALS